MRSFFLIFVFSVFGASDEFWKGPFFWDEKPEVRQSLMEKRSIPVSMMSTAEGHDEKIWWIKGAGMVKAPADFIFAYAKDIDNLTKHKEHFQDLKWDKSSSELSFSIKAIGQTVKFKIKMWDSKESDDMQVLHFLYLEGPIKGMEGALVVKAMARQESQVSLILRHKGDIVSFGSSVMSIAVEGLLHHMAESLRSAVEQKWKEQAKDN